MSCLRFSPSLLGVALLGAACTATFDDESLRRSQADPTGPRPDAGRDAPIDQQVPKTDSGAEGAAGTGGINLDAGSDFEDFPADPIVVAGTPPEVPGAFGSAPPGGAAGGLCLTEPPLGAMYPINWTPPRFEWTATAGLDVFELRLAVDNQRDDLVVYTSQTSYTLDATVWTGLATHSAGRTITLSLRGGTLVGGQLAGPPTHGAQGDVHIAPVAAPGSVVYWTTSAGSALKGFSVGQSIPTTLVEPSQMGLGDGCVGCHTASPDGSLLMIDWQAASPVSHQLAPRVIDATGVSAPSMSLVSPHAASLLARPNQTAPVFSAAHFSAGDSKVLSVLTDPTLTAGRSEIIWTDLHATTGGTGVVARNGDPRQATTPSWSEDGETIAYGSTDDQEVGVPGMGPSGVALESDIYTVPFAGGAGGAAVPLAGASEPGVSEYYPAYSPEDVLVAFDRSTTGLKRSDPMAEVFVVPAAGGAAVRVAGNDPPACSGQSSPGVANSWPRWAPQATTVDDQRYFWLVFSSTRRSMTPQLFVSAIVTRTVSGADIVEATYPAIYVTSQIEGEGNHTPAWTALDVESLPK